MTLRSLTVGFMTAVSFFLAVPHASSIRRSYAATQTVEQSNYNQLLIDRSVARYDAGPNFRTGVDNYHFEGGEALRTNFPMKIIFHHSFASLNKAYGPNPNLKPNLMLMAFTRPPHDNVKECEMHIIDPNILYYPEFIGHELLHCTHDDWHAYFKSQK